MKLKSEQTQHQKLFSSQEFYKGKGTNVNKEIQEDLCSENISNTVQLIQLYHESQQRVMIYGWFGLLESARKNACNTILVKIARYVFHSNRQD